MNWILFVVLVRLCSTTTSLNTDSAATVNGANGTAIGLPIYEVDAMNLLLQSLRTQTWDTISKDFKASDCDVRREVSCSCNGITKICHITKIFCWSHDLSGKIPEEIGNLSSLRSLDLGRNKFTGFIPSSISKLLNLTALNLRDNLLEGTIPPFLGKLTALTKIYLSFNLLDGPIPDALCNLSSLQELGLSQNRLSGMIPNQLGSLTKLSDLYLYDNQLSGPLPVKLGNLSNLQYLSIENNKFIGQLPPSFKNLRNLVYINLQGNKFTGKVPEYIGNWRSVGNLRLSGNNFEGPLPLAISKMTSLTTLGVSDLIDTSSDKRGFLFPDFSRLNLTFLTLRNCTITDKIPDYMFQMETLNYLDLSFNNLIGDIPDPFLQPRVKLPELPLTPKFMFLRGNKLNGSLPDWLINRKQIYVDVSENNFTLVKSPPTHIPKNLNLFECCNTKTNMKENWQVNPYTCQDKTKYSQLFINCGGEETPINKTVYEADTEPYGGATFFLSSNKRWGYSSMGVFFDNGNTQDIFVVNRTCNMSMADSALYTSARLAPISLKYYGFCLKNGKYRVKLHFAEIVWDPDQGHRSRGRRVFDVEIQGKKVETDFNIAEEAGGVNLNVTKEYTAVVSNFRLEIHLFWIGSTNEQQIDNGPLISAISASREEKKHNGLSPLEISGIVGTSLLLPLLVLLILWRRGYFVAKNLELEALKAEVQGKFFNFQQIKVATQNFSSNNKLGEGGFGSVYKGLLPDGTAIAVKQFSARSMQGIREFVNEIGTVSALQHPNLVKLLGCCAEDSQRLLVYEYMENNSLQHALFGSEELRKRLDWATRVRICHGIAKGLAFLHEESELKVVHRDIKPTNILLDKDLTPKISDFGFAKLYEGEATHIVTRVAGTTGYMAPEYAMRGHLTYKADVYSFGVVLLEIVSGKNSASYLPNDQSVYLLDLACVLQKEGNLIALIDPTLEDYEWDEANTILNLALLCTDRSYTLRPTMSEVVKILEGKSKISKYTIGDHYSMDDSAMAKMIAGLSESTHSGSTSQVVNSGISLSAGNVGTSGGKETSFSS